MRLKKTTRTKRPARSRGAMAAQGIFLAGTCVMGAAILIAARQPSQSLDGAIGPETPGAVDAYARKAAATPIAMRGADAKGVKGPAAKPPPVTITGCLEKADDSFRLRDTSGADAPKARSWKTGFLKKGPAPIAVVDSSSRLKLPAHVGQRVSVTGTLVDRGMQARSLQRVAASCARNAGA